jgi:hypothetical protein
MVDEVVRLMSCGRFLPYVGYVTIALASVRFDLFSIGIEGATAERLSEAQVCVVRWSGTDGTYTARIA